MRTYIFEFKQEVALEKNLSLTQLLILDYLIKFFSSGNALIKNINGKKFGWIAFSKISSDLPILKLTERAWQRISKDLEQKHIIERTIFENKCFICINKINLYFSNNDFCEDYLTEEDKNMLKNNVDNSPQNVDNLIQGRQKCTPFDQRGDKNDATPRQICRTIVNYYNNKIKILIDDELVQEIDSVKFLTLLKSILAKSLTPLAYDICIKNMSVVVINQNLIVLSATATSILKLNCNGAFEQAVGEVLEQTLPAPKYYPP